MFQTITGKPFCQSPPLLRRKLFGGLVSQTRTPPECGNPKGRFGRGLGNPHGWILGQRKGRFPRKNQVGASEVPPRIRFDALTPALPPLVRPSHAQAPAVSSITRAPCRKVMGVAGQRSQAARQAAAAVTAPARWADYVGLAARWCAALQTRAPLRVRAGLRV